MVPQEPLACVYPYCRTTYQNHDWWGACDHYLEVQVWTKGTWFYLTKNVCLPLLSQLGWLIGDNIPVNDVAVHHVCKMFDPDEERLTPEEIRGWYVKHSILNFQLQSPWLFSADAWNTPLIWWCHILWLHSMFQPFKKLGRRSTPWAMMKTMRSLMSRQVLRWRHCQMTWQSAGSHGHRIYGWRCGQKAYGFHCTALPLWWGHMRLSKVVSSSSGCSSWDIKLWVRTQWGSLSDCFHVVLALQKVWCCQKCIFSSILMPNIFVRLLTVFVFLWMMMKTYHHLEATKSGLATSFQVLNGV